jgi:hypothetical protein
VEAARAAFVTEFDDSPRSSGFWGGILGGMWYGVGDEAEALESFTNL